MSNLTNYAAPTVELALEYGMNEPIYPCSDCLPWTVRIVATSPAGVGVIETHAIGCDIVTDAGACHEALEPQHYCPFCGTYNPEEEV